MNLSTIPSWFLNLSREGKELLKEVAFKTEERRLAASKAIADVRARQARALPKVVAHTTAARARADKVEAEHQRAQQELVEAARAEQAFRYASDREIATHEAVLRETADPAIAAFRRELEAEWQRACANPEMVFVPELLDGRLDTGKGSWKPMSGRSAIEAVVAARAACDALELEVGVDVRARLAEIRGTLPWHQPSEASVGDPAALPADA